MAIVNGRFTMAEGQLCTGCVSLRWKDGGMFMSDAYCTRFNQLVGDDWSAATAPRPLIETCYEESHD